MNVNDGGGHVPFFPLRNTKLDRLRFECHGLSHVEQFSLKVNLAIFRRLIERRYPAGKRPRRLFRERRRSVCGCFFNAWLLNARTWNSRACHFTTGPRMSRDVCIVRTFAVSFAFVQTRRAHLCKLSRQRT